MHSSFSAPVAPGVWPGPAHNVPAYSAAQRKADQARRYWADKTQRGQRLQPEAQVKLHAGGFLSPREVWLLLAVFESKEAACLGGKIVSLRTRWFDNITPKLRDSLIGVAGFTARTAAKHPDVFDGSGNGYINLTDLGYALVLLLRKRHPELNDVTAVPLSLPLAGLYELPRPSWRLWKL